MNEDWSETKISELLSEALFSRDGFRFAIGITSLRPEVFFATQGNKEMLRHRHRLLQERPALYVKGLERAVDWLTLVSSVRQLEPAVSGENIHSLGASWEPDFVVLERNEPNQVLGGCVCFPSGWSLPEKIGKSLFATHAPVPGMNRSLAPKIGQFISRLDSKRCFQRTNWGLTGSPVWDQHPHWRIPPISAATDPATADLRIEWQAIIGLPGDLGLFGIRVFHVPLSRVRATPKLAESLAENLVSMPSAVAEYKRLADCRSHLISYLRE
ncbi:MAG TPA: heme-dependent oxidative N-demethylase subunit alpha family protein [Chthoniobacterales bacterium]|nr:heme-dependent oxidative N-demethylase subunit alpha family protein [Chthoniobacterales bacterium]